MNSKRLGGVLALVAVAVAAWLFLRPRGDHAPGKSAGERASNKVPSLATQHVSRNEAPSARSGAFDLDLDPEGPLQLEGQVVDAEGHGVAGAEVWLGAVPPRSAKTEGDGTFSFGKLVGRTYRLTARSGQEVAGPIAYKLTDKSDPAILQLAGAAKVIVSVHDDEKKPIANAEVKVDEDDGVTAKTGPDGTATLGPVHPGWVGVHAKAEGFASNGGFTSVGSANAVGGSTSSFTPASRSPVTSSTRPASRSRRRGSRRRRSGTSAARSSRSPRGRMARSRSCSPPAPTPCSPSMPSTRRRARRRSSSRPSRSTASRSR